MKKAKNEKYNDEDYTDEEIEALMRYYGVDSYAKIVLLLKFLGLRGS